MSWTDIEVKWAAMTRRVQSDRPVDDDDMATNRAALQSPSPRVEAAELRASARPDRSAR